MEPVITIKQQVGKKNIKLVESIAKQQKNLQRSERLLKTSLIVVTYVLYFIAYLLLYKGYVDKTISFFNKETWIQPTHLRESYLFFMGLIFTVFSFFAHKKGLFSYEKNSLVDLFFKIVQTTIVSFLVAVGVLFMLKTSIVYSRVFITGYALIIILVTVFMHITASLILKTLYKHNRLIKNVLIIGAGKVGSYIGQHIKSNKLPGYRIIGYLDDHKQGNDVLGKLNKLDAIIQKHDIHEVYITIPSERDVIQSVLGKLKKFDITIKIVPEMYDIAASTLQFNSSELLPYVELVKTPLRGLNLFMKRLLDIVLSGIGLIFLLPFFAVLGVLIKLDSKGPVFFKQKRIGKNGIPFTMYKFRSMVVNAEDLKKELLKQNEMDGPVFKMKEDPRITRLGRFIRKYSIDELPQLFNVFLGHMSLIGPRPPLPEEVEQYTDYQWRRLDVRPGISGLWQVSGRNDVSFEEWVSLDIYYIENWSMKLDIKILIQTIPVVLLGKGAY